MRFIEHRQTATAEGNITITLPPLMIDQGGQFTPKTDERHDHQQPRDRANRHHQNHVHDSTAARCCDQCTTALEI